MKLLLKRTAILLLLLTSKGLFAQQDNLLTNGLALQGYDAVSYFTNTSPTKGNKTISIKYNGALYLFSTAANKEIFKKDPAKYTPAYGGWCAYAMAIKGEKVEVDPLTYKIKNGKLLLFYNAYFNNTLTDWNKNENSLYQKAETNWKKLTVK